jgi:hypothetical protein
MTKTAELPDFTRYQDWQSRILKRVLPQRVAAHNPDKLRKVLTRGDCPL